MDKTYTFYSDPSHGWLEVQRKELKELNILNNVSEWSYIKGEFVYLEEDCDANIFINAYKSKFGVNPKIYEPIEDNYEIRSYRRFKKAV
jgi:predicted acyltransferase (DUF342 family)